MLASAAFYYSYGVFLPFMCQEFGWSRGVVAAGLSVGTLFLGLPSPLIGILVAKLGPRKMLFLGNLLFALCLVGMSQVREVWQVYVLYSIGGFGAGCGGMVPSNTITNNWFSRKRAFAMGISSGLMGLGGFIIPPLVAIFISSFGWRTSWLAEAGIVLVFSTIIGPLILVRNKPEDVGQLPDGVPGGLAEANRASINQSAMDRDSAQWTVKRVMRQPATWLIISLLVSTSLVIGIMHSHQVAHIQDLGFSSLIAATTVSVLSIAGIVGNLGYGGLVAKFGIRKLVSVAFVVRLAALVILLLTSNLAMLYIYAILFGISGAMIQTTAMTLVGNYYGRARFPQIIGTIAVFMYIFLAAGPVLGGFIFDSTGAYTVAFIIMIVFTFGGLLCVFFARPPQPKNKQTVAA
jgi:MFS family permease